MHWLDITITNSHRRFSKKNDTTNPNHRDANRGANLGPWLHHIMSIIQMEQQPLAGSHRKDYEKLQGNVAKVAGSLRQVPVEVEELRCKGCCFLFRWLFGNVWHGFLYHIHQKHSKTICIWYTVCTNISKLICFGVGILRARQNFGAQQKPPKWIPTPKARAELEVLKRQRHEIKAQRKQASKRVQSVHSHPVEGSNLFKTIVKTHGVPWDTCVG